MSYLFFFAFLILSSFCHYLVSLLPLFLLSETQSMSVCVSVILCYQPSPNTPPQTHISHFGMMTLPVLASLIMILNVYSCP